MNSEDCSRAYTNIILLLSVSTYISATLFSSVCLLVIGREAMAS